MALVRYDPFNGMQRFFNQWPSLTSDIADTDLGYDTMDVYETDNDVVVCAAVPGVPPENVEVTFEDGVLRIQAHYQEPQEKANQKKKVYKQRRMLDFDYATTLPRAVEADKITADVDDGVVTIMAPIAKSAKPRKIQANSKKK